MPITLKDIKPPVTIEWIRHSDNRGSLTKRATVVEKAGRNLKTDEGDWLWWATITRYGPVEVVENTQDTNTPASGGTT